MIVLSDNIVTLLQLCGGVSNRHHPAGNGFVYQQHLAHRAGRDQVLHSLVTLDDNEKGSNSVKIT